ncbi:MAG TPA: ATP-binding protein, partial [Castellaniella sp.]|nr:ATP-binding protein [Castellaniella sp.]
LLVDRVLEAAPPEEPAFDQVFLEHEGLMLTVPAMARLPALRLSHRSQGWRLFSTADVRFISDMCDLLSQADAGRRGFEDAIHQERRRIARDLHDDVGARLLMLIHRASTREMADLARHAMGDLRSALSAIDAEPSRLSECLADWRAEAQARCDAAGAALAWMPSPATTDPILLPRQKMLFTRALRECLSNSLKHVEGGGLQIELRTVFSSDGTLSFECLDNGRTSDPAHWVKGRGIRGLEQRLQEMGGTVEYHREPSGTRATVQLTLAGQEP